MTDDQGSRKRERILNVQSNVFIMQNLHPAYLTSVFSLSSLFTFLTVPPSLSLRRSFEKENPQCVWRSEVGPEMIKGCEWRAEFLCGRERDPSFFLSFFLSKFSDTSAPINFFVLKKCTLISCMSSFINYRLWSPLCAVPYPYRLLDRPFLPLLISPSFSSLSSLSSLPYTVSLMLVDYADHLQKPT